MRGKDKDLVTNYSKKLSPTLVTLLSSEPEPLRIINLFIQKRPDILNQEKKALLSSTTSQYTSSLRILDIMIHDQVDQPRKHCPSDL